VIRSRTSRQVRPITCDVPNYGESREGPARAAVELFAWDNRSGLSIARTIGQIRVGRHCSMLSVDAAVAVQQP